MESLRELKHSKGISFCSLNVRSIFKNLDEVSTILENGNIDMLLLQETFLTNYITNDMIHIDGYNILRSDRDAGSGKRGGGGLMVYYRKSLNVTHLIDSNLCNHDIEYQWLCLNLKDTRKTYIGNIYCPPDGNRKNALELVENKLFDLTPNNPDFVIMGDFNIDLKHPNKAESRAELSLCRSFMMKQLIQEPTRITSTSETLIDHVIINREDLYYQSGVLDVSPSDHSLIYVIRKKAKIENNITYIWARSYRKYNWASFRRQIESTCWQEVLTAETVDEAVEIFYDIFLKIIDQHAPYKWIKIKEKTAEWITNEFLSLIDTRNFRMKKYRKCRTDLNWRLRQE